MSEDVCAVLRRLPVYLLLDCSGSMAGEPIAAMEMGLKQLLSELKNDPQAMETVWLSVLTFDSTAQQLVPLTDLKDFVVPDLEASGTTAMGEAVTLLMECIEAEVRRTTPDQKGDWRPFVFVFTDGAPTDAWEQPVADFRSRNAAEAIVCGAGPDVDEGKLRRLGDTVIRLDNTQPGTLIRVIQWLTVAITMHSKSLGTQAKKEDTLPKLPEDQAINWSP